MLTTLTFDDAFDTFGGFDPMKIPLEDGVELNLRNAVLLALVKGLVMGDDIKFFLEIQR